MTINIGTLVGRLKGNIGKVQGMIAAREMMLDEYRREFIQIHSLADKLSKSPEVNLDMYSKDLSELKRNFKLLLNKDSHLSDSKGIREMSGLEILNDAIMLLDQVDSKKCLLDSSDPEEFFPKDIKENIEKEILSTTSSYDPECAVGLYAEALQESIKDVQKMIKRGCQDLGAYKVEFKTINTFAEGLLRNLVDNPVGVLYSLRERLKALKTEFQELLNSDEVFKDHPARVAKFSGKEKLDGTISLLGFAILRELDPKKFVMESGDPERFFPKDIKEKIEKGKLSTTLLGKGFLAEQAKAKNQPEKSQPAAPMVDTEVPAPAKTPTSQSQFFQSVDDVPATTPVDKNDPRVEEPYEPDWPRVASPWDYF